MSVRGFAVVVVALLVSAPVPGVAQPKVQAVLNAGSLSPFLAPGTLVSIFGTQLASAAASASSIPLPTQLNGVYVKVGSVAAFLLYVSPDQVNAVIPFEVATVKFGRSEEH